MRFYTKASLLTLFVFLISLFSLPQPVLAQSGGNDQVIFGTDFTLNEGEVLEGNLILFSGSATLQKGSTVNGDITVFGGSLDANGIITGSVTSFGGTVNINASAVVNQNVNIIGGKLNKTGTVKGTINEGPGQVLSIDFIDSLHLSRLWVRPNPTEQLLWMTFICLAAAALAALVSLFLPRPTARMARAISSQPFISGGIGCLSMIVFPALMVVMAITIILIPISGIGLIAFAVACVFGWIGLGTAIGGFLFRAIKVELPTPIIAGVGTFLLSLIVELVAWGTSLFFLFVCCIGFPFLLVILSIALGGVVTTAFGSREFILGKRPSPPPYPPIIPTPTPPAPPQSAPSSTPPPGDEPLPPTS